MLLRADGCCHAECPAPPLPMSALQSPRDVAQLCAGIKPAGIMAMYRGMKIVFSVCAIMLWANTLLVLRPISKNLGPLLYVIGTMLTEVLLFLVPLAALILGFGAALLSLFPTNGAGHFGWDNLSCATPHPDSPLLRDASVVGVITTVRA